MKKGESKAIDLSQLDIPSRRKCIKELYQLGLSLRAIAVYAHTSRPTVSNDYRHIPLDEKAVRPNNEKDAFKAQFLYFERFLNRNPLQFSGCEAVMHATLTRVLMIDSLIIQIHGAVETMNRLAIPGMTPEQESYYALFAKHVFKSTPKKIESGNILGIYYSVVKLNEILLPDSRDNLFEAIVDWYISWNRMSVMPILPNSFLDDAASVISSLSARERDVLHMRFGLSDNQPKTLFEIGAQFGVTIERVRQIESKAIRKLKKRSSKVLSKYFLPLTDSFQALDEKKEEIKRQKDELHRLMNDLRREKTAIMVNELASSPGSILSEPIDYLELSVRSHTCLTKIDISTVGDLIRYSEAELMDISNFGKTSLEDVKSKLAVYGLRIRPKE